MKTFGYWYSPHVLKHACFLWERWGLTVNAPLGMVCVTIRKSEVDKNQENTPPNQLSYFTRKDDDR